MSPSGRTCSYFFDHGRAQPRSPDDADGHAMIDASAIDPLADASDGVRALADHAADVQFCAEHFI